jgi:hypothetical protein
VNWGYDQPEGVVLADDLWPGLLCH